MANEKGVNVGVATLTVLPVISNLGKNLSRQLSSVDTEKLGVSIGKDLSKGISKGAGGLRDLKELERELEAAANKTAKAVEDAREREADAARKAKIAQSAYNDAVEKYGKESTQALRAEDRLVTAKRNQTRASSTLTRALKTQEAQQKDSTDSLQRAERAAKESGNAWQRLGRRIKSGLRGGKAELDDFEKVAKREGEQAGAKYARGFKSKSDDGFGSKLKGGLKTAAAAGAVAVAGGAVAAARGLGSAITKASEFDATMRQVGVQTKASGAEMQNLSKLAIKMGAETSFSAQGASDAMLELAKGGLSSAQIQSGALKETLTLATAGGLELGDAAGYVVQGLSSFNLEAKDASRVSAALAGAANASTADVSDLGIALGQSAAVANGFGVSIEDTAGALSALTNNGIKGSDAGTSLKTMLTSLIPQTDKAQAAMEELGLAGFNGQKALEFLRSKGIEPASSSIEDVDEATRRYAAKLAGVPVDSDKAETAFRKLTEQENLMSSAFFDANGNMKSMESIAGSLQNATKDLTKEEKQRYLRTIFGSDAQRAANVLATEGAAGLAKYVKATKDKGAAEDLAKSKTQGFAGAMENFQGAVETAQISLGTAFLPILTKLLKFLTNRVMPAVQPLIDRIGKNLPGAMKTAQPFINGVVDVFKDLVPALVSVGKFIFRLVKDNMPMIKQVFRQIGTIVKQVVSLFKALAPVVMPIIKTLFGWIVRTVRNFLKVISGVLDILKGIFTGDFELIKKGVKKIFSGMWDQIKNVAETGINLLGNVVDGIKKLFEKPINWVINTVLNDGIIRAVNWIAEKLGKGKQWIKPIPNVGVGTAGKNNSNKSAGGSTGGGMRFAAKDGGVLPGYTPGRDVHHFRSPTGGELLLSGGEAIMRPEWTKAVGGPRAVEAMNRAARHGRAAFKSGGVFQPVPGHMNSHGSGYYGATTAGDFPVGMGTPVRAWKDGVVAAVNRWNYSYGNHIRLNHGDGTNSLYAHLSRILVDVGQRVAGGSTIGNVGSTGNSTGPHLHFETRGGAYNGGAGGGSGATGALSGIFAWAKDQFVSKVKGFLNFGGASQFGPMGELLSAAGSKLVDVVANWGQSAAGKAAGSAGSAPSGSNQQIAKAMLAQFGFGADQWGPLQNLWMKESGFRTTATNPSSGAYGIPQSLPASKMASAGPDWRTNPATQIRWGLQYIKGRYGTPAAAWAHSQRLNWYAKGTKSAKPGWAVVGEEGPELMKLKGGEKITSNKQLQKAARELFTANAKTVKNNVISRITLQIQEFQKRLKKFSAGASKYKSLTSKLKTAEEKLAKARREKPAKTKAGRESQAKRIKGAEKEVASLNKQIRGLKGPAARYAKISERIKDAQEKLGAVRRASLVAGINKATEKFLKRFQRQTNQLAKVASKRAKIRSEISKNNKRYAELWAARGEARNAVRDSFAGFAEVPEATSAQMLVKQMKARLTQAKGYFKNLQKLRKMGLNPSALQQLIDAGPEGGAQAAAVLVSGGYQTVRQMNSLQSQIKAVGEQTALWATAGMTKKIKGLAARNRELRGRDKSLAKRQGSIEKRLTEQAKKGLKNRYIVDSSAAKKLAKQREKENAPTYVYVQDPYDGKFKLVATKIARDEIKKSAGKAKSKR